MKVSYLLLISLLIVGALFVPAVSAYEQTFKESQLIYGYGEFLGPYTPDNFSFLSVKNIAGLQGTDSYAYVCSCDHLTTSQRAYFTNNHYEHTSITGTLGETDVIFTGKFFYNSNLNPDGSLKEIIYVIEFDNIDIKNYNGAYKIKLHWDQTKVPPCRKGGDVFTNIKNANDRFTEYPIALATNTYAVAGKHMYHDTDDWYNTVKITETDLHYTVEFIRDKNPSWARITDADTGLLVYSSDYTIDDVTFDVRKWLITSGKINVTVVSLNANVYNILYPPPGDPDNIPVVVYVKSTQTGALLNDARIIIKDTTTTPWSEVVNQTLPSGHGTVSLAKDPNFNPTQYQISVTAAGYQQVVPAHFFRVTGPMSVVVEMEPLEGGPVDEDNTFLEFYVTDLNGNGISNAQVYVGGQLRWTNAQGYTQFEVPKNTSYSYDVSKSGYVTIKGSATVGDGPRYTVNVVLGPKTDPTEPPVTDPDTSPVNVYVKSSQTGALLADAQVIIKDTTTTPWSEVVNQTLPSGHGAVSLVKDPGFNPTQYQISVTVPGYQQVVPALFFRVTGPTNVVVEMEPLEGGPVDEDNTFLEFYVRNLDGNPVSNAQVYVGGQLRWTNAQGWIQFEVAKNASYPYTVSKSGYVTIEGTTTVGDGPRYTVNVVLGPKTDPTEPPGPGVPTPTSGIPDEDDDSDGLMMQAVRGIANLFGVSFGIGKTILGMLLALGIGTATAKQLKGGAQEFGMGMLGGVVLGVLIGLLPIWVLVLLVLIVGLWIGQRYMSGGDS